MSLLLAPLAMCAFCSTPAFSSPQLIFYCTKLKSVRTWIVRSPLGFSFIYPPSWSVSDRRPFTSIYFAVVSPSLGSCFAISFLPPLISHLFFGACLSNASFCNQGAIYPLQVSVVRCRPSWFQSFPPLWTSILWNVLPHCVFTPAYNLSIFKGRINKLVLI